MSYRSLGKVSLLHVPVVAKSVVSMLAPALSCLLSIECFTRVDIAVLSDKGFKSGVSSYGFAAHHGRGDFNWLDAFRAHENGLSVHVPN